MTDKTVTAEREALLLGTFQQRVQPWMVECFGPEISSDRLERNDRFIEEALELVQAGNYPKARAHELVEYVYGRPQGDINQEVGGVMVTLAAHCLAHGIDMHEAGETELARIWTKVAQIRAKQAAKPRGSALPIAAQHSQPAGMDEAVDRTLSATVCDGEDVQFYLRASCIVPNTDGEPDEACTDSLAREVVRTILTAAGLPALVNECERLRAEVERLTGCVESARFNERSADEAEKRAYDFAKDAVDRATAAESIATLFGELMAVMHADGGHYLAEHGPRKSADDAIAKYYRLTAAESRAEQAEARHWAFDAAEALRPVIAAQNGISEFGDTGQRHLIYMLDTMQREPMSATKACRWLGWIQAALVANGAQCLADMKAHNKRFSDVPPTQEGGGND